MRRIVRMLAVALTLCALRPANAPSQDRPMSATDRVVVASRIYALVQQYFAHWDGVPRLEVEAAYREYIDKVVQARDRKEFALASMRFIAKLRNGHTQFLDNQMDGRPLKFRLIQVRDSWVVVNSQDSRLARGAVVKSINGIPVGEFVAERAQYVAASNDRLARAHVFSYPGLFPERISVGLQNGDVVVVDRAVGGNSPQTPTTAVSQGRWLRDGHVAYIRVPAFGDPAYERTAIELVRQFTSAPALVIDVRGNGGGMTPLQLIGALMNRPWRTWQETTPQRIALSASRGSRQQSPSSGAYAGRLFLLVDRFCGSACEDFVMPFKDTGRAVVVGETTQGSSGNPYREDLGDGIRVAIGAVRYAFPDGTAFEGVGIAPDILVERSVADLVDGRDTILERAMELANSVAGQVEAIAQSKRSGGHSVPSIKTSFTQT